MKKLLFLSSILLGVFHLSYAQNKFNITMDSKVVIGTKDNLLPHYQYSNQWGTVAPYEQSQAFILPKVSWSVLSKENIELSTGGSAVVKGNINRSFLHEAYLNARFYKILNFSAGKESYSPISFNDDLSVGGFMRNNNSRPIPRIQMGFWNYVPVGFLNNKIEVKGGISHGWLNDSMISTDKWNNVENLQIHEKWAYIRLGGVKMLKPYIGLFHGALMGGTRSNGAEIPIDYLATFFGGGSEKIGGGEATNAAGAHDGFWDLGVNLKMNNAKAHFYIQKPYADRSGLLLYQFRNKDYKIGALVEFENTRFVQQLSFELIKTDVQAGYGLPDPIYPKGHPREGQIIWLRDIVENGSYTSYDDFIFDLFEEVTEGFDFYDARNYLIDNLNHGWNYGQRDDYNNNGMYYSGWTYEGMPMGLPLYHTYEMAKKYAPDWKANNHGFFVNNRVKGVHLGLEGQLFDQLGYRFKATYTNNLGSYNEEFVKRYSWEVDPDNLYKGGKQQWYTNLSLNYKDKNWNNLLFKTSASYDFGQLYNAFGIMFGIAVQVN